MLILENHPQNVFLFIYLETKNLSFSHEVLGIQVLIKCIGSIDIFLLINVTTIKDKSKEDELAEVEFL